MHSFLKTLSLNIIFERSLKQMQGSKAEHDQTGPEHKHLIIPLIESNCNAEQALTEEQETDLWWLFQKVAAALN